MVAPVSIKNQWLDNEAVRYIRGDLPAEKEL